MSSIRSYLRRSINPNRWLQLKRGLTTVASESKPVVHFLDLSGSGLSILERLVLEECLYQIDTGRNWLIVGAHGAHNVQRPLLPPSLSSSHPGAIVMGIGGKAPQLLYTDAVQREEVTVIRRFSGGGTVLMDENCIWTTLIGRPGFPPTLSPVYPRPLMEFTADAVFGPLFQELQQRQTEAAAQRCTTSGLRTLVPSSKSCGGLDTGGTITTTVSGTPQDNLDDDNPLFEFSLREHDYVLGGTRKMGGNAQSIGKNGWLHHTSFLWYLPADLGDLLRLPAKRPEYRQDRSHQDFLVALADVYPQLKAADFRRALRCVAQEAFDLHSASSLPEILHQVLPSGGTLTEWYQTRSRTKIVTDF